MITIMAPREESAPGSQAIRAISQPAKPRAKGTIAKQSDVGGANCSVPRWGGTLIAGVKYHREDITEY
jgi:hypothetical protein